MSLMLVCNSDEVFWCVCVSVTLGLCPFDPSTATALSPALWGRKKINCTMTTTPPLDTGVRRVPGLNMVTLKPSLLMGNKCCLLSLHISACISLFIRLLLCQLPCSWITPFFLW